jgi:hypothetical protein
MDLSDEQTSANCGQGCHTVKERIHLPSFLDYAEEVASASLSGLFSESNPMQSD